MKYIDFDGTLDAILTDLNQYIKNTADTAIKAGFYAGQANAGIKLEQCHKNWIEWVKPAKDKEIKV